MSDSRQPPKSPVSGLRSTLVIALGVTALVLDVAWAIVQRATNASWAVVPSMVLATLALIAVLWRAGVAGSSERVGLGIMLVLTLAGTAAFPLAHHQHVQARLAEEDARLAAILDDPWLTPLLEEHGFGDTSTSFIPQASPRAAVAHPGWCASEGDGPEVAPLGPVPGLVVQQDELGAFRIDPVHLALPDELRAMRREDVRWIALAHRSDGETLDRMLGVPANVAPHGARIDLRVIDLSAGSRLARITCGMIGRYGARAPQEIDVERVSSLLASVIVEGPDEKRPAAAPPGDACPTPREPLATDSDAECAHGATPACRAACEAGSASSCLLVAFAAQHRADDDSASWFWRGCTLGHEGACTNYAAWLSADRDGDEAGACAAALYDHACRRGNAFACGMWGASIARGDHGAPPDRARASARLVLACEELGHFACAMLGTLRARGELDGSFEQADADFRRACETGYQPSCEQRAADFVSGAAGI